MSGTSEACNGIKDPVLRARRRVDQDGRAFNIALWRVATGKPGPGGVTAELAAITGLSPVAIRARAAEAGRYPEADPVPAGGNLTIDDRAYLGSLYNDRGDPHTRDFLQGISGGSRRRPDHDDARVARQRIRLTDGSSRLISISIDLARN